jgi:hypothetical protein
MAVPPGVFDLKIMIRYGLDPDQGVYTRLPDGLVAGWVKCEGPTLGRRALFCFLTQLLNSSRWSITHLLPIFKMEVVVGMVVSEFSTELGA